MMLRRVKIRSVQRHWNALPIFPPALLPGWLAFPVYPQSASQWLHGTCRWRAWWFCTPHLVLPCWQPLLLDLPGLPCRPACLPFHPLHCPVCFLILLLVSLFQPLWSGVHNFLLQGSPALDGLPGICCDPLLSLLLSVSHGGFADLSIGYSDLLPHGVDVALPGRCMFFSICQWLKLVFQLDGEGTRCSSLL